MVSLDTTVSVSVPLPDLEHGGHAPELGDCEDCGGSGSTTAWEPKRIRLGGRCSGRFHEETQQVPRGGHPRSV